MRYWKRRMATKNKSASNQQATSTVIKSHSSAVIAHQYSIFRLSNDICFIYLHFSFILPCSTTITQFCWKLQIYLVLWPHTYKTTFRKMMLSGVQRLWVNAWIIQWEISRCTSSFERRAVNVTLAHTHTHNAKCNPPNTHKGHMSSVINPVLKWPQHGLFVQWGEWGVFLMRTRPCRPLLLLFDIQWMNLSSFPQLLVSGKSPTLT